MKRRGKPLSITPHQRKIAILSAEGLNGVEISRELDTNENNVSLILHKPHVIAFKNRQEARICDKIAEQVAVDMAPSINFLNEHLLEHIKSINDIGKDKNNNPATRLKANESFCRMAGMSFKEKENKTDKLPDIKAKIPEYKPEEKKETG